MQYVAETLTAKELAELARGIVQRDVYIHWDPNTASSVFPGVAWPEGAGALFQLMEWRTPEAWAGGGALFDVVRVLHKSDATVISQLILRMRAALAVVGADYVKRGDAALRSTGGYA